MTSKQTAVGRWLNEKFQAWRAAQQDHRAGVTAFARHIGITRDDLNNYMLRGVQPEGERLKKIGRVLGPEVYDLLGLTRPDPQLRQVMAAFVQLPPAQRGVAEAVLSQPGLLAALGQTLAALGAAPTPRRSAKAEWKKLIDDLDDEQVQQLLAVARELRRAEQKERKA
jgi:hypothetical protein